MPSSIRRIISSRTNGALSKGPKTDAGKRRSSQNNLRHGLYTTRVLLPNESPQEFAALFNTFLADLRRRTPDALALAEQIALNHWHHKRLSPLLDAAMDALRPGFPALPRGLDSLQRHSARLDRDFLRLLNNLPGLPPQRTQFSKSADSNPPNVSLMPESAPLQSLTPFPATQERTQSAPERTQFGPHDTTRSPKNGVIL